MIRITQSVSILILLIFIGCEQIPCRSFEGNPTLNVSLFDASDNVFECYGKLKVVGSADSVEFEYLGLSVSASLPFNEKEVKLEFQFDSLNSSLVSLGTSKFTSKLYYKSEEVYHSVSCGFGVKHYLDSISSILGVDSIQIIENEIINEEDNSIHINLYPSL